MPEDPPLIPVCGIGASAGGVEALQQFFRTVKPDLGLAFVVVVHLAPDRKSELPAILARATSMPVTQVGDHDKATLAPNHVFVIAPDKKLEITETSVGASPFDRPHGQRNAIDLFFRSLAERHGDGFAIVLSGSGSDGALGAKAIKEHGGLVLVQDPADAAHGDMPRAAIATGVADVVLPVHDMARHLAVLAHYKQRIAPAVRDLAPGAMPEDEEKALRAVLDLLRKRTSHDFSKYKRSTVLRRLLRRMQLSQQTTIRDYADLLLTNGVEVRSLLDDLLISVTTFFRDPESWRALQARVIGPLVERAGEQQIRCWVPGCATGEEAYSLAILFLEEFERRRVRRNLLIFASDIDESAIAVAREARYPRAISADVSEERLDRYFRAEDDHYLIQTDVRDPVVFAAHSLLRDPPFSRLDLVTCRNLLIYLDRELQEQVMAVLRYSSRNGAYLFLGASETASDELFQMLDSKHRIFVARDLPDRERPELPALLASAAPARFQVPREPPPISRTTAAEVHLTALEAVAPPSVLVDDRWNVLHLSSSASRFFLQAGGAPARRLTDLVRPELRDDLHVVLHRTIETLAPQLSSFLAVRFNGEPHRVAMLAQRHQRADDAGVHVLVTFLDAGEIADEESVPEQGENDEAVRKLRENLRQAEERIETMRDDHFRTNEDLRAANEELQSLNEEYRSTTEELETSKEELQSINEELQTVNHELKMKLDEVSRTQGDLENFVAEADVAMLFLDRELRIKRFTPKLAEIFNVKVRDLDRPIGDLTHGLDYNGFQADGEAVLLGPDGRQIEREARNALGRIYVIRFGPYRSTNQHDVEGVVVTFIDVTAIKQVEAALRESERRLASELAMMRRLHQLSLDISTASSSREALQRLLETTVDLHDADFGNVQMLDGGDSSALRIVAQYGFAADVLAQFDRITAQDNTACGRALRERRVVQVPDVLADAPYEPYRISAAAAGFRSVQSTPLVGPGDEMVGVLSVHFRKAHVFTERDSQLSDLLGQQAAALIVSRRQQDHVLQINDELSRQAVELERSRTQLTAQAAALQDQDRHREEFLASLGHELRNPMAAMQGAVALLSVTDDRSRRALAILERQIRHMTRLVNDLLDATRVKHGRLRLERVPVDLNQCALAAIETQRAFADAKGLRLNDDVPSGRILVDADPERLAQVFDNLLRNAILYTDRGDVTVTARREGRHARVSIRDTGIGLDPGRMAHLFEPFQPRDVGRGGGGLGLGLSLVKNLIEAHGGTIEGRSEGPGAGSEFTFTLPLAIEISAPPATPLDRPPARRVLVVDDQADVADMFGFLLEELGQDVRVAHSGADALSLLDHFTPEVAFIDLAMPGMSGMELGQQLRQRVPRSRLTLVAMTGFGADHASASRDTFDQHLLKPVTAEMLGMLLNGLSVQEPRR